MADPRKALIFLTSSEIAGVNAEVIRRSGGALAYAGIERQPGTLDYICALVADEAYDLGVGQSPPHRAAFYAYTINTRHIFFDGNKRTSMVCAFWFLERNGWLISEDVTDECIVRVTLAVACGQLTLSELTDWFEKIAA